MPNQPIPDDKNDTLATLRTSIRKAVKPPGSNPIPKPISEPAATRSRTIGNRVYLSEDECHYIDQLRQGISFSAFARARLLSTAPPRPRMIVPQLNREAYIELAKLAANCNQITKAINAAQKQGNTLPLTKAYLNQLARLEALLIEIRQQLSQHGDTEGDTEAVDS